jgi:hypothetical protein
MATSIGELTSHFLIEVDDVTPPEARAFLMASVQAYNAMACWAFSISGDPPMLDRDADDLEKRALVLMAIRIWLAKNSRKYSLLAFKHSNVAGSTNLTGVEFALAKRIREMLEQELGPLLKRLTNEGVIAGTGSAEVSLSLLGVPDISPGIGVRSSPGSTWVHPLGWNAWVPPAR